MFAKAEFYNGTTINGVHVGGMNVKEATNAVQTNFVSSIKDISITLTYEESFYDALAQKSYDKQIGARGIERAFQDVLDNINFMDITSSEYQEVIFTGECVSDPSKIILIPKEKGKVLKKSLN